MPTGFYKSFPVPLFIILPMTSQYCHGNHSNSRNRYFVKSELTVGCSLWLGCQKRRTVSRNSRFIRQRNEPFV